MKHQIIIPKELASEEHIRKLFYQISVGKTCTEQCLLLHAPLMLMDQHMEDVKTGKVTAIFLLHLSFTVITSFKTA